MNFIKGFLIGFIFTLMMFFVVIPSMFMEDTSNNPITFERIHNFYKGVK